MLGGVYTESLKHLQNATLCSKYIQSSKGYLKTVRMRQDPDLTVLWFQSLL